VHGNLLNSSIVFHAVSILVNIITYGKVRHENSKLILHSILQVVYFISKAIYNHVSAINDKLSAISNGISDSFNNLLFPIS